MFMSIMSGDKLSLFCLFISNLVFFGETTRIVTTSIGRIQGELHSDGSYYKFLGVPYAHVDLENPFGVASPSAEFDGIFEANDDSIICPQVVNGEALGTIDCLNLNVYVPSTATASSQLPVVVWLYGGFFKSGRASENLFGPKFLVRHDVIVVTLNYRTGAYGFMCVDTPEVPGNQGLKDQQLALEWVKQNVQPFGGNPDQVTLAGQSAGAHSVDMHLLSEKEALFNKVILQSGSSLARTVLYDADKEAPISIAENLGLNPTSLSDALSLLKNSDAHSVVRAATDLNIEFKPCAETQFDGVDPFITHHWLRSETPKVEGMPVLIGFVEYERMITHITAAPEDLQNLDIFYQSLNQTFEFDDERIDRMENYLHRFYLGERAISQDEVWQIINFDSDYIYNYPIQRSIRKYLASDSGNIFYYMFAYSGGRNFAKEANNVAVEGAAHADELGYLFEMASLSEEISEQDQLILDRMTTMWTNFAKYSDPTPQTTDLLPVRWTPLTSDIYHYLRIDSDLTMERRPFNKRMAFFDLFYKYNDEYQRTFETESDESGVEDSAITQHPASLLTLLSALLALVIRQ